MFVNVFSVFVESVLLCYILSQKRWQIKVSGVDRYFFFFFVYNRLYGNGTEVNA